MMLEPMADRLRHAAMPPVPAAHLPGGAPAARVTAQLPGALASADREPLAALARCLAHMLDEVDLGMLLVDADGRVLHLNHTARSELDEDHPLQIVGKQLIAPRAAQAAALHDALCNAQRGLRKLLQLGTGPQRIFVSVVPMPGPDARAATLLMLGRRNVCEKLTMQGFAREMGLTPAETRVFELLRDGVRPTEIASCQGVAVSTVRTQIGSIRAKTGARSIRELVRQVATLPPLVGALRSTAATFGAVRMPLAS